MMNRAVLLSIVCSLLGACDKKSDTPSPATTTPVTAVATSAAPRAPADPKSQADTYFKQKCVVCHGDHGAGDGPGAAALNPKPRAFAIAEWQDSVTDEHLAKIIVQGGAAVGKSPAMPPNPDLQGKDELVQALVKKVRSFKK